MPVTAGGAPAPSWAALSTRASAASPAAQPAQHVQAPAYLPRTFVPCSQATRSAQGPKPSAAPPARAAACADLPAQGPTPAAWAGAASAPQPPQDVLQMAQRAGLPRGVFVDDRGRRWALGGGAPPVLLPHEPNPRPSSDPSAVPLAASADAAPSAPSTGVLAAVIVLGLAACGLGAVLAAWCSGVCSPSVAFFCGCCKCAPWLPASAHNVPAACQCFLDEGAVAKGKPAGHSSLPAACDCLHLPGTLCHLEPSPLSSQIAQPQLLGA